MAQGGFLIMSQTPKYKVWWDEKNQIIHTVAWGDFEEEDARSQAEIIVRLVASRPGKVSMLHDLTESGKASSKARKIYADLIKLENIERQAFVGMKTITKVIVSFIMKFSGVTNARYFNTEQEALKWLKKGKEHGPIRT
jgi:hypothetical protein